MSASTKNSMIIDSLEFARKSQEIYGTIAASDLPRLHDALFSAAGELQYQLSGGLSDERKPQLRLRVQGSLRLSCQRCLEAMELKLDLDSSFIIVPDEASMPLAEVEPDDEDYLVANVQMRIAELIEDEVLLGLPLAPTHSTETCSASAKLNTLKKVSPFAVLHGLKISKR